MRRLAALALVVALAGCAQFKDLFTAHANEAAEAGSFTLPADRLGNILAQAKGLNLERESAVYTANVWIDYALFAQAVARRTDLRDSATVAAALWPEIAQARTSRLHDSLVAHRPEVSPSVTDSLFKGSVRLFQHILYTAPPNATPKQLADVRAKAEATLRQVKGGADFGAIALKSSQDPGSGRDRGYLPPSPRGAFVAPFDSAGWLLEPGQVSGVVMTQFGAHIIRRPPLEEVRERFQSMARQASASSADSVFVANLVKAADVQVKSGAPADMRAALATMDRFGSTKALTTSRSVSLDVGGFLKFMHAISPQAAQQIKAGSDSAVREFAKTLTVQLLLLRAADSAKIQITPDEWKQAQAQFGTALDSLAADMGLTTGPLGDKDAPVAARLTAAEAQLNGYFEKLLAGTIRIRPLPSQLAVVLREKMASRVNDAGLLRALELAKAKVPKDSAAAKAPAAPGAMQPAPGGPPVGEGKK